MPGPWKSWTKSLSCKREEQVHNPVAISAISTSRAYASAGCSKSLSNLKDVIHGNTLKPQEIQKHHHRHHQQPQQQQPRGRSHLPLMSDSRVWCSENRSRLMKHEQQQQQQQVKPRKHFSASCHGCNVADEALGAIIFHRDSYSRSLCRHPHPTCQKCGESFSKYESLEHHLVAKHAVTELGPRDSSKNVVEIIFRTSWVKRKDATTAATGVLTIERVLKIHNTQRTIAKFEEYRDSVKSRASSLQKKHARCIADGNELLRFHAAALRCNLGLGGSSATCASSGCTACRVIRTGFRSNSSSSGLIHTAATSGRAHEVMKGEEPQQQLENEAGVRAMLVCRVIAGRMHKGLPAATIASGDPQLDMSVPGGFDSIAGDPGLYAGVDDLYIHSSRALLPCFVVIYRP